MSVMCLKKTFIITHNCAESHLWPWMYVWCRDAPEPTGDEGEDMDMEMPKVYEPIPSFSALEDRLQMFLSQYNEMVRGAGMDLVFFIDAMIHLTRVSWIVTD